MNSEDSSSHSPLSFPKRGVGGEFTDKLYLILWLKLQDLFYRQVLHFIIKINGYITNPVIQP